MKVYKYDTQTKEFIQELEINEAYGTNLPFTTTVKPLTKKDGFAICFNGTKWEYIEDNRNTVVYNKETKQESKIHYLGNIKEDVTTLKPEQFDKWDHNNNVWIVDLVAKDKYDLEIKIAEAKSYLASTDFYMTVDKYAELDEARKVELTTKRAEARELINTLEAELITLQGAK